MTTLERTATSTQVYRVYIKAPPQAIWDAITQPDWTDRYGYTGRAEYELRTGGAYRVLAGEQMKAAAEAQGYEIPEVIVDGEVLEADPPRKLVQTWRLLMDPDVATEGFTRVTYEITDGGTDVSCLTLTHQVEGAPKVAAMVSGSFQGGGAGGGWSWVLSDLKTLLETGTSFAS